MKKTYPVRGTKDLLEEEFSKYQELIEKFRCITFNYGFREISTPIMEYSEVFKKTLGLTSDIIKKETYTFKDRSNNEITLRPEGTASIVRCFINNKLNQKLPQKLSYSGPMFRYDRPQQGRLRQFHQLGAEIIGTKDFYADLELVYMAKDFLNQINIPDESFKIHVNNLGDKGSRKKFSKQLQTFFQDHKKNLTPESLDRLDKNPLRILDTKNKDEQKLLKKAPKLKSFLNQESCDHFENFKENCKKLDISFFLNDNLVRGLDYYNHICYEFVSNHLGSQNALLAGGRYDGLIKDMGGPEYPGCGFAIGLERILMIYKRSKEKSSKIFFTVISLGKRNVFEAFKISNQIRKKSKLSFVDLICKNNLSEGLKYASEKNANYAIIIGEQEISKKQVTIKDLKKQTQKTIKITEFVKSLPILI